MNLVENSTCKITVETQNGISTEKGTGFFISTNQILTCKHVIDNLTGKIEIENCYNQNGQKLTAIIIDSCEQIDYALLELIEDFESEYFLELCDSEIVEDENITIFGYPIDNQGQVAGERLKGVIDRGINSGILIQDVSLNILNFAHDAKYNAFSGSAVVNDYSQVTSIVKYQAARNLSAVSIRKAKLFLEKNCINVKHDQIVSFDLFNKDVFIGFANMENECEVVSKAPLNSLSPKLIIEKNKNELFYPKKNLALTELISYLRRHKNLNDKLWKGWIQLLTYVEMLKGDYSQANSISIKLTSKEIYRKFGFFNRKSGESSEIDHLIPLKVTMSFRWKVTTIFR